MVGSDTDAGFQYDDRLVRPCDTCPVPIPTSDAAICVQSPRDAPIVRVYWAGGNPPEPKGGKIVPGKYHIAEVTIYPSSLRDEAGARVAQPEWETVAIYVTESTIEFSESEGKFEDDGGLTPYEVEDKGIEYATRGNQLFARPACPAIGEPGPWGYTATPDELTLFPRSIIQRVFKRVP